eukprot:1285700-Pleurochrysis_carterae.AAC.1
MGTSSTRAWRGTARPQTLMWSLPSLPLPRRRQGRLLGARATGRMRRPPLHASSHGAPWTPWRALAATMRWL